MNIYEKLTDLYGNTWSTKNLQVHTQEAEGRMCLFLELWIETRVLTEIKLAI